jgi:adenylate cyclase
MTKRLGALNDRLAGELQDRLRIGIGIHCGEAIVGTMGPPSSPNLSAIGDNINIAARLEGQCKIYGVTLVVSKQAARQAGIDLSSFDMHEAPVRGREEPVVVYAVPDPSTITELMAESVAIDTRRDGISDNPIV